MYKIGFQEGLMRVNSKEELAGLKRIGRVVAQTIQEMKKHAKPGITTKELDILGSKILKKFGANSAPKNVYNFPAYTCICINHEVAHGIPSDRSLKAGDLVNIDVSAELNGYYADAGHSFQIPPYDNYLVKLCDVTHATMMKVITHLRHGTKVNEVGRIIEEEAKKHDFQVIKNLCSHGIGRSLHEDPKYIMPIYNAEEKQVLLEGQVITIEPFLSTGADHVITADDGWTLMAPDKSYVAQHEHTIVITKRRPVIITQTTV
jgi:methionyl aminopeptidase